ncbi:hypothetical protein [Solirubrum puertoriconensis]|uniref:Prolyl-tRNA synthetase n=1 Tax=Solirubrum puertoriconensis TaxID=1751427 RepID=A0A9X0L322_SOLP1|nr:hypothetical protein [Solirubrum puertoriconensis]KUG06082.1 hypothetical protein ASU33_01570 [Solirubrum puertoriconensis]
MKHIPATLVPALALLTLGGCTVAQTTATTEPDGVYYSSKDRTTELVTASTETGPSDLGAATDDPNAVANPEYRDGSTRPRGSASDEYYADDYDYSYSARIRRFHQPSYRGLGLGYYDYAYTDYYWYNPSPFYYGYDIYGRPWGYDPFWGPSWSAWGGPYVSVNLGWGNPWGGYYNPYRPWGYGFGGGYNRGFYDGFYSGYYGNNGGGWRSYRNGRNWGGYGNDNRNVNYRPRRDRGVEAISAGNTGAGRPRVDGPTGGRMANTGNVVTTPNAAVPATPRARGRVEDAPGTETVTGGSTTTAPQPGRGRLYRIVEGGTVPAEGGGRVPSGTTADQPARTGYDRRRSRIDEGSSPAGQPQREVDYSQPRPRRERTADYSSPAPERPRSYDAPQRSYEAPQRSYEAPTRSYDRGNSSSGGFNGGNSGGGGSRGGRGRVD